MGFHKRRINKENLIVRYNSGGIENIKTYFNADAIMVSDDFSSKIFDLLCDEKEEDAIELFKNEIDKIK
jgi:hypothetical protein